MGLARRKHRVRNVSKNCGHISRRTTFKILRTNNILHPTRRWQKYLVPKKFEDLVWQRFLDQTIFYTRREDGKNIWFRKNSRIWYGKVSWCPSNGSLNDVMVTDKLGQVLV